eukprot:m.481541 g.481541  ORF g.481541 m.481541 type:complete len:327 (-) comp22202_c0_seq1:44-1024(-)
MSFMGIIGGILSWTWWLNWTFVFYVGTLTGVLGVATYLFPLLAQQVFDLLPVNLKTKYDAKWAVVTGASSGIGKAIVEKLVAQEINVVLVALEDELLDKTFQEIVKANPSLEFRKVGVDLSRPGYLEQIDDQTKDLDINLVFNNAGYITPGVFARLPLEKSLCNYECNATAAVKITHLFMAKMLKNNRKGFFAYTSSSAGFVPGPLTAMYASTKAFMTMFATSVAPEVRDFGIDVAVVHPSPMRTNFFSNAGQLSALLAFERFAVGPSVIADVVFSSAGRFVVRDQGIISILLKFVVKAIDINLFSELVARFSHQSPDFKTYHAKK